MGPKRNHRGRIDADSDRLLLGSELAFQRPAQRARVRCLLRAHQRYDRDVCNFWNCTRCVDVRDAHEHHRSFESSLRPIGDLVVCSFSFCTDLHGTHSGHNRPTMNHSKQPYLLRTTPHTGKDTIRGLETNNVARL